MSSKNNAGDFRRISRETWQKFKEYYPESGPTITLEYSPSMSNGEEPYIGKHFVILDPPAAPKVTISKSKKKKALAAQAEAEAAAKAASQSLLKTGSNVAEPLPSEDDETRSQASHSFSSMASSTANRPKVVSNLPPPPGQVRNPVAEQFAREAMERSHEGSMRTSERSVSMSSQQGGPAIKYGSLSSGAPTPQVQAQSQASVPSSRRTSVSFMYLLNLFLLYFV